MSTVAITLADLTVAYRGHPAVHHLSGEFAAGSLTAIVGPNGAGKTSLLTALMGGLPCRPGAVRVDARLQGRIAWLPQQAAIDRSFPMQVGDLVALGHWARLGSFRRMTAAQAGEVEQALAAVGLAGFERRSIGELSAGQFQRVLFARVLLQDAPVILLDEPFNAIDARSTADLLAVVARWHAEARTVIAVLHDLDQVRAHFSQTLLLARRAVAWGPTAEVLSADNLWRARQMAEGWDDAAPAMQGGGMTAQQLLIAPFVEYGFMRRALVASLALALGSAPIGLLLVLRRMSLVGDAMAHALLPGAALGFVLAGFSLWAMSLGGFVAALAVALGAGLITRRTAQREDASFAALYLIALAGGVLLISSHGNSVDLMHVLFGSILAVDDAALLLIAGVASVTLLALSLCYRPLVVECCDPGFLRHVGGQGGPGTWVHGLFLVLAVANLVAGFQALGTLMAVGLMMLPATAARFWAGQVWSQVLAAGVIALLSGWVGLLVSFHGEQASGPSIVLVAGGFYGLSLLLGPREGLLWRPLRQRRHRVA